VDTIPDLYPHVGQRILDHFLVAAAFGQHDVYRCIVKAAPATNIFSTVKSLLGVLIRSGGGPHKEWTPFPTCTLMLVNEYLITFLLRQRLVRHDAYSCIVKAAPATNIFPTDKSLLGVLQSSGHHS
jgi:hypothetical protein